MRDFFKNWAWYLVEVIFGFFSIALLFSIFSNPVIKGTTLKNINQTVVGANVDYTLPEVKENDFVVENGTLEKGDVFNWRNYVSVKATNGIDLRDYIVVVGDDKVDTSTPGAYKVKYKLNWNGKYIEKEATYYVKEEL